MWWLGLGWESGHGVMAPNTLPTLEWPAGVLRRSPGTGRYQPICLSGRLEKGLAEQGTWSLCSPALPALPPALPASPSVCPWAPLSRRLLQQFLSPLPISWAEGWHSGTRAFLPGWSFTASRKRNVMLHTG